MPLNYNAPGDGTRSSIDTGSHLSPNVSGEVGSDQMNTFFWLKKAIIEARKEQFFMTLSSTENIPKHFGKTIKVYQYVP